MKYKLLSIVLCITIFSYRDIIRAAQVTFNVDLSVYINAGIYISTADSIFLRADFNNWTTSIPMLDPNNDHIFTATFSLEQYSYYEYKFWINNIMAPSGGWENSLVGNGGPYGNRTLTTAASDTTLTTVYFNNLTFIPQDDPAILCYAESNYKREPNISPGGNQITFYYSDTSNFDGSRFPILAEIDENFAAINVRSITDNTFGYFKDWDPVFRKPNGNEIYFTSDRYTYWDIMKYDQQNQAESFVFRWGAYYAINNLRFSPDGSKFVCDGENPTGHYLMIFDEDGTNPQTLYEIPSDLGVYEPDWSPDGSKILIEVRDTIYTVNINNPLLEYVFSNNSGISHPKWSPDGSKIVFSSVKNGNWDIWVINSDGTDAQQLTTSIWDDGEPVWDGNRNRIYFLSFRWSQYQNIYSLPVPNSSITGLVAYYPFNGNPQDSSGNSNNGSLIGGVTWGTDRFNESGKAAQFNGIDGYIEVPNSATLQSPTNAITIAGWIYIEDFPGTEVAGIVMKTISNTHGQYGLGYQKTISPPSIYYVQNGQLQGFSVPSTLNLHHWYFIAITKDNDSTKIFIDGEVIGSGMIQEQIVPDTNPVTMGFESNIESEYLHGKLDDIRIFNTALTESEILELYHENGWPMNEGLAAYYPFNGNAADESGNGNNGTVNGATLTNDRFGNPGEAYFFNGSSNDFISIPSNSSLSLTNELTLSAWVNLNNSESDQKIVGKATYAPSWGYVLGIQHSMVYPEMYLDDGTRYTYQAGFIPDNEWTHLCVTWRTGGSFIGYVNGEEVFNITAASTANISTTSTGLIIGTVPWGPGSGVQSVNGSIDDIRIYNRALTGQEVQVLFHENGWPINNTLNLKRKTSSGGYEEFKIDNHAWRFSNSSNNMWPQNWWSQFDYCRNSYPLDWCLLAKSSDFPDWPLFVNAFGEEQCYLNPPPELIIYNPGATLRWFNLNGYWGGSCFGFAISSFLFFDNYLTLPSVFPGFEKLYDVPIQDESRKLNNLYWIYQFGKIQLTHINNNYRKNPVNTLNEIREMFLDTLRNDKILVFFNQNGSGGHAVNPYKISMGL